MTTTFRICSINQTTFMKMPDANARCIQGKASSYGRAIELSHPRGKGHNIPIAVDL